MKNLILLQIRVPNQTRYLSLIGKIGESVARDMCRLTDDKDCFAHNLNAVLTEAMVNTIKHANAADPDKDIRIRISISDKELLIRVYDSGEGFDLESIADPSFQSDLLAESGRGIFIIRSLMDSVVYKKTVGGNVLEMKKTLG